MAGELRVLLVDDDAVDRLKVRRTLNADGLAVQLTEVETGETGISALEARTFDCVLLDFYLPDMNAFDMLARIAQRMVSHPPVVILTGRGDETTAVELMKAGATDYLAKGQLMAGRLAQTVRNAVRIRAAQIEAERAMGALRTSHAELERRVEQRTAALRESHQRLEDEIANQTRMAGQLRDLAAALTLAEERQRREIAVGIHDLIGQNLALLKIRLGGIAASVADPKAAGELDGLRPMLDEAIRHTRDLTFEMASPILYELGLEAALRSLADRHEQRHGTRTRFEDDGQPKPLGEDLSVVLYRAVRELLVNVSKHAEAGEVRIVMNRDGAAVRLTVSDDGRGFNVAGVDAAATAGGYGLFSIRQRLEQMGGGMAIRSSAGKGTCVTLKVPLASEQVVES